MLLVIAENLAALAMSKAPPNLDLAV